MPPTPNPASTAITLTPKLWSTARPAKVARICTDFRARAAGEQGGLAASQGPGPDERLTGFHDAQNHPGQRDDQHDLLQDVEQAADGHGELQEPTRQGQEEHEDQ